MSFKGLEMCVQLKYEQVISLVSRPLLALISKIIVVHTESCLGIDQ